jgi:hypothetical protein
MEMNKPSKPEPTRIHDAFDKITIAVYLRSA